MNKKRIIWMVIIAIIILAIIAIVLMKGKKTVEVTTAKVEEGTVSTVVTSTGYVQPVQQVSVGTQVSGVIDSIYVDFNSHVKRGQLLATLDMSVLNERLFQANASLSAAQSALDLAQQTYNRTKLLFDQNAAPKTDMESATNTLSQAQQSVKTAKSNVEQARINLSYAKIFSPIDGVILNRAVDQGQTVAASFNTPTLFLIANDLTKMEVQANMDEADIGKLQDGQKVTFTVDAYPSLTFNGTVKQIRLNAVTTNNVVTYTVIINAPNPEQKLFPGMTANITVITQEENGLIIPMGALTFTPSAEVTKKLRIVQQEGQQGKGIGQGHENGGGHKKRQGVWIQDPVDSLKLTYQPVEIGLNDGINAIVTNGLQAGQKVVESVSIGTNKKVEAAASNPLIPRRPQNQGQRPAGGGGGRPF